MRPSGEYGVHTGAITTTSGLTVLTESHHFLTVDGLVKSVPAMMSKLWLLRSRLFTTNQHVKLRPPRISTSQLPTALVRRGVCSTFHLCRRL